MSRQQIPQQMSAVQYDEYGPPEVRTGFDFAGDVVAIAEDVTDYGVGDGVWGFLNGLKQGRTATAAEYVLADVKDISRRPGGLDATDAAALPGAAGAALATLDTVGLHAGERILIRGQAR